MIRENIKKYIDDEIKFRKLLKINHQLLGIGSYNFIPLIEFEICRSHIPYALEVKAHITANVYILFPGQHQKGIKETFYKSRL